MSFSRDQRNQYYSVTLVSLADAYPISPPRGGEGYAFIFVGESVSLPVCLLATLWTNAYTDFQLLFRIDPARNKKHSKSF